MPESDDGNHSTNDGQGPGERFALDRRSLLLGGSALAAVAVVDGCSGSGGRPTTQAPVTPDEALAAPGTAGLVDEEYFQSRVEDFLGYATESPDTSNVVGTAVHLTRAAREPDYSWNIAAITPATFESSWDKIDSWADTRDFDLMYLQWLLHLGQGSTPMTRLDPAVGDAIAVRMIANRYRYDDPLPADRLDEEWFWSENHRIIGLANEYLAGQRYPTEKFAVTGMTGAGHRDRARPDILEWIDERARFGFFEWHSNVYLLKDVVPLLMLCEQADDSEIVKASAMALDLCVLDMAAHLQQGCFTAPRGRTYEKDKMDSRDEDTWGVQKFLFDDTDAGYTSPDDSGPAYFCAARRYRPPRVMIDIATSTGTSVVRERHGVFFDGSTPVTDDIEAPYGKNFDDPANLTFWWSLGAVGMWPLARVGVAAADRFRLWETEGFEEIDLLAKLNDYDADKLREWEQPRAAVINFGFLSEANTYAWRHPRVSLASVIDHRKGEMRDQAHAWQAAIDEGAMVFTTHPVTEPADSEEWSRANAPAYWTGSASMPRSAQFERTAIHLYDPAWDASTDPLVWSVLGYRDYTHAYFPQDRFDRVVRSGNWTVGERDGGYIALWSWRDVDWRDHGAAVYTARGFTNSFDLVAEGGADNVWIVECGTREDDGSLDEFVTALQAHAPQVEKDESGFVVAWESPSAGEVRFGWEGPFTVGGADQPLEGFPRHDSPWGTIERESTDYELSTPDATWNADFSSMSRQVS